MIRTEIEFDRQGLFRSYIRILSTKTRDIDYHAFVDHDEVSMLLYRVWVKLKFPGRAEWPGLIGTLLNRWQFRGEIDQSYAKGLRGRDVHPLYIPFARAVLPVLYTYQDLGEFMKSDKNFTLTSAQGRNVGLAWANCKLEGRPFVECLDEAESFVGKPTTQRDTVIEVAAKMLGESEEC